MSALISALDVFTHMSHPDFNANWRVIDASWYLPAMARNAHAEYQHAHIPGAVFWDIDALSDHSSPYPHMLPPLEKLAELVGNLGISHQHSVVVYDGAGLFSAARVWWSLRALGHKKVWILDGGLPAWKAAGLPFSDAPVSFPPQQYHMQKTPSILAHVSDVQRALISNTIQVLDARSAPRFQGQEAEPRAGVRAGHMPGAFNLPYKMVLDENAERLLKVDALAKRFEEAGVSIHKPIIASCGSGITACILAAALYQLGQHEVMVYDGSWAEWGSRQDLPVATDKNA